MIHYREHDECVSQSELNVSSAESYFGKSDLFPFLDTILDGFQLNDCGQTWSGAACIYYYYYPLLYYFYCLNFSSWLCLRYVNTHQRKEHITADNTAEWSLDGLYLKHKAVTCT